MHTSGSVYGFKKGINSELTRTGSHGLNIEVTDKAGNSPGDYNEEVVVTTAGS